MPAARQLAEAAPACIGFSTGIERHALHIIDAVLELPLYCPACWDRIDRGPIPPDMEEIVSCTTCFTETKRSDLLVRNGTTLLDHLVSLNTAKK